MTLEQTSGHGAAVALSATPNTHLLNLVGRNEHSPQHHAMEHNDTNAKYNSDAFQSMGIVMHHATGGGSCVDLETHDGACGCRSNFELHGRRPGLDNRDEHAL